MLQHNSMLMGAMSFLCHVSACMEAMLALAGSAPVQEGARLQDEGDVEAQLHVGGIQVHRPQQRRARLRHLLRVVERTRQQQQHLRGRPAEVLAQHRAENLRSGTPGSQESSFLLNWKACGSCLHASAFTKADGEQPSTADNSQHVSDWALHGYNNTLEVASKALAHCLAEAD